MKNFKEGNLKNWYKYTKDKYILDAITNGLKLDLNKLSTQNSRSTYPLSSKENEIISIDSKKLLKKFAIVYEGEFISCIFTRDKKDANKRMIPNLKRFNKLSTISTLRWNLSIMSLTPFSQMFI